jgi:hypothetical protein
MAMIAHEAEAEQDLVFEWRLEALARAGYPPEEAWLLAASREVDLRVAERLLAAGCPPTTATRILI